ncbi:MAG: tRNA (N6-isopentenyl adenosine(37)-C2)-methylthiotransferase MiaB [Planctomycetes bacterium]|nr:tRNA (N6-isopentenyl adenosine(37)-C2)-methylthiotransferase MiaB [Planctomycetota bacterium]
MSLGRVYIETFGCQMNVLETELVLGDLRRRGFEVSPSEQAADVILFNTCSIRENAENRVYGTLGQLKGRAERDPNLVIGVFGCMAQKEGRDLVRRMPHIDLVCGTHRYGLLGDLIRDTRATRKPRVAVEEAEDVDLDDAPRFNELRPVPFVAFVQAMRGCDCRCTFCVVPYTKGTERSRPIPEVVEEVRRLVDQGVVEVTLLGQNITSYGKNLSPSAPSQPLWDSRPEASPEEWEVNLADLLAAVDAVPGLRRTRFLTGHPAFVTDRLLRVMAEGRTICPFLHMPAQSGSNRILKRMKRGYTKEEYLEQVAKARELIPDLALAGDFIVGFPGETEADLSETLDLLERTRHSMAFLFKYSQRPKTPAERLPDDVPDEEKKRRHAVLSEAQHRITLADHRSWIGRTTEVLVEGPSPKNAARLFGRTRGGLQVVFEGPDSFRGRFIEVAIAGATNLTLYGERVGAGCLPGPVPTPATAAFPA